MKHTMKVVLNSILFAMAVTITCWLIVVKINYLPAGVTTNTNATVYQSPAIMGLKLVKYTDFRNLVSFTSEGTYIIPGLRSTMVGLPEEDYAYKQCRHMVPQGVCATDKYILVSAYCHAKQHNSVIYMLDKETHKYRKTIMLNGKAHVGGITYDPLNDNVWVCFKQGHTAQVGKLSVSALEKYYMGEKGDYIHFSSLYNLEEIAEASFITYHKRKLYIGLFSRGENAGGVVQTYALNIKGEMQTEQRGNKEEDDSGKYARPDHIAKIADEIQGVTFYEDKVIFTRSYGALVDSHLLVYDYVGDSRDYSQEECVDIVMPNMMEQISTDGDKILALFESCGRAYRFRASRIIDRVCLMDGSALMNLVETKKQETTEK